MSALYKAEATITRPNDTTAYTALDVISTQAGAVLTFDNIGPANGVALITAAKIRLDVAAVPSGMGVMRLHLYNSSPTAIADNAAFNLPSADRAKYIGSIDIGTPVDLGDTIWAQNNDVRNQVILTGDSVYGILQTVSAYTPTANAAKTITLLAVEL